MFFLFYCFSLFTDYVMLVYQHRYSAVLEHTLFPIIFLESKNILKTPQIFLKVMEYCSKTLQIIILILGVGSKNIL